MWANAQPPKTKTDMLARLAREGVEPVKSRMGGKNTLDYETADGSRVIRLHETDILTFHANGGITINTGGFNTVTTRARVNAFLPAGKGAVYTHRGVIHYRNGGREYPFSETVYIGPRGAIRPDVKPAHLDGLRRKLDSFMAHVRKRGLPTAEESAGDPWCISPDVGKATALDWLESNYFTRTLYALALQYAGLTDTAVSYFMRDAERRGLDKTDLRRIRRYMRAQIGLEA